MLTNHFKVVLTTKIGIQKVLGSTVLELLYLLSRDFLKMMFVGFLLATPIAWDFPSDWLSDFPYRIDLAWSTMALASLACFVLTLLTVGFKSLKAATINTAKRLRTE
ncbi:MAG: hypothetical protein HKN31_09725 [Pricia sp.]|nr:hypothetical protein [Pricia sp.]